MELFEEDLTELENEGEDEHWRVSKGSYAHTVNTVLGLWKLSPSVFGSPKYSPQGTSLFKEMYLMLSLSRTLN